MVASGAVETRVVMLFLLATCTTYSMANGRSESPVQGATLTNETTTSSRGSVRNATITEPTSYTESHPEPTSYAELHPEPTSYAELLPEPTSNAELHPEPTSYAELLPEPTSNAELHPEPTSYAESHPEPTSYAELHPEPTSYAESHPEPHTNTTIPDFELIEESVTLPFVTVPLPHLCHPYLVCDPLCDIQVPEEPVCPGCEVLGCGTSLDMDWNRFCGCDSFCMFYGDCCGDFADICPGLHQEALAIQAKTKDIPEPQCVNVPNVPYQNRVQLVASCGESDCPISMEGGDNMDQYPLPVIDLDTGVSYLSIECAECNGVTRMQGWGTYMQCGLDYDPKVASRAQFVGLIKNDKCRVDIKIPSEVRFCIENYNDNCNEATCRKKEAVEACHNGPTQLVSVWGQTFQNTDCMLCSLDPTPSMIDSIMTDITCGALLYLEQTPPMQKEDGPSLVILFDFTYADGETSNHVNTDFFCPGNYAIIDGRCVKAYCSFGVTTYDVLCEVTRVDTEFVHLVVETRPPNNFSLPEATVKDLEDRLYPKLKEIPVQWLQICRESYAGIGEFKCEVHDQIPDTENHMNQTATCSMFYLYRCGVHWTAARETNSSYITALLGTRTTSVLRSLIDSLAMDLEKYTRSNYDVLHIEITTSFADNTSSVLPPDPGDSLIVDPILTPNLTFKGLPPFILNGSNIPNFLLNDSEILPDCLRVKLTEGMYELHNDTLVVESLSADVPQEEFVIENNTAYICKEFYERHFDPRLVWLNRESRAMRITSTVCLSASVFFLLVRIVLQPIAPVFHTFPNKLQFLLCVTLCLAFLLFLLAPFTTDYPAMCYAFGTFIHWGFLASFCCMMSVALHMFRTFRYSAVQQPKSSGKMLCWYLLLGLFAPSLIVCVSVALDFLPVDSYYQPQYGVPACWIGGQFAHIAYFGVPMGVVLLVNISLLIGTSVNLHRAFKTSASVNKRSRSYELRLNARLAVLLGVTWVIAFVAPVVNNDILWFMFIILCGLQGAFIFFSFVCTKQVWNSLKERYTTFTAESSGSKPKTISTVVKTPVLLRAKAEAPPAITLTVEGVKEVGKPIIPV